MGDVAPANQAAVVAGGAAGNPQQQPPAAVNTWSMIKGFMFRMVIIYVISSMFRNWRGGSPEKKLNTTDLRTGLPGQDGALHAGPSQNLFHKGFMFDLYVYLSENERRFRDFNDSHALLWSETGLTYGDWTSGPAGDGSRTFSGEIEASPHLQANGSIFIHVFVVPAGKSPDALDKIHHSKQYTIYQSRRLNKYKKKRYEKTKNLLTGETEKTEEHVKKAETVRSEILSHWHPNLTLNLVEDYTAWTKGSLPPPLDEAVRFDPVSGSYYPVFFFNDYWNLLADYQPINDTVKTLNISITYSPMSLFKWQMYASQGMRNKWAANIMGGDLFEDNEDDQDSLKQAILETNPYLLGLTMIISILHTIFEFMAFKNDIQFWRNKKSLEGLSVRSVLFNVFTSGIVLLYVFDNDTNWVVRISIGIGLLIELWKIPKCMDVKVDFQRKILGVIPRVSLQDKGSYVESSTKEYDNLAFKYLSWLLFPLLGGYAVYSLIYHEHRGWYSFVLSMLYGFLLTFGFIMMTPQLFINYKLKSVAHLPWRMLTYKFLNTFIDDIFAFVIKMPTMYRIGCFRDDIVFLIYVYQRWIYRVDHSRVNEFGVSGEDLAAAAAGVVPPSTAAAVTESGAAAKKMVAAKTAPGGTGSPEKATELRRRNRKAVAAAGDASQPSQGGSSVSSSEEESLGEKTSQSDTGSEDYEKIESEDAKTK